MHLICCAKYERLRRSIDFMNQPHDLSFFSSRFVLIACQAGARAVILSPTRELCQQTERVVRDFCRFTDLVTVCLIGGESLEAQFAMLAKSPDMHVMNTDYVYLCMYILHM